MQGWIERTGLHLEQIFGRPPNVLRNRVTVRRAKKKGAENQEIERPLEKFHSRPVSLCHCVDTLHHGT
jgi:hypothetical protein